MVCNCNDGVDGFGIASCVELMKRAVGFGFQKTKSYNAYNSVDGSVVLDQATWETLLYTSDKDVRMNVLRNVKNVTDERADPEFENLDGIDYVVAEGQRYISFEVIGTPSKLKSIVEGLNCGDYSVFTITAAEQLGGWKNGTDLRGVPIEKGTLYTKIIPATRTTKAKLMVKFMIAEAFNDGDTGLIPSDDVTADLLGTNSQIQIATSAVTVASATTITLDLDYYANDSTTPQAYVGAVAGDFDLYNNDTALSVAATVAEGVDGSYTLTFAAQTTADDLELRDKSGSKIAFTTVTGLVAL